jgi:hypothetical protein
MTRRVQLQTLAFIHGLEEIVPKEALIMLNEKELGLLLVGMPTLDCKQFFLLLKI